MKFLVFICLLPLVYNFAFEEEESEVPELLDAVAPVQEEARSCKMGGQVCKDDCDCCINVMYCHCPLWGILGANSCSCIFGDAQTCKERQRKCTVNRPQSCPRYKRKG